LRHDEAPPSLMGFLGWLRSHPHEIKRDMEASGGDVRLMTVHGAKGLEAPIVFLPDTTSNPTQAQQEALIDIANPDAHPDNDAESNDGAGMLAQARVEQVVWTIPPSKQVPAVVDAKDRRKADTRAESNRLLYVAMTRAEDELYVCGRPQKKVSDQSWYALMAAGLEGHLAEATGALGQPVKRLEAPQTADGVDRGGTAVAEPIVDVQRPEWMTRPAAPEPRLQIPIQPSRLAPLQTDDSGDPIDDVAGRQRPASRELLSEDTVDQRDSTPSQAPAPSPRRLASDHRFVRGNVTHALLQYLPTVAADARPDAARRFVAVRANVLSTAQQSTIVDEVLEILAAPRFADAFGPNSRAEVSLAVALPNPNGGGPPLTVTGQIDRLVTSDDDVAIIDFKTNRPPPVRLEQVAETYVLQLSAYRLAVRAIFPGKGVRAALLWTDGARLMEVPDALLTAAEPRLWRAARVR
ncbi:MAG: PD-(D/E)XK nuclease family protein, partial [Pseudomonadota bacterium]